MEELLNKNVLELGEALRRKEISSVELTTFYLKRIEKYDGELR
jgi:Asp-tRNA(Asn)/Glu-tRNA(Gln) amidotransferase A subunit family amidase